MKEVNAPFDFVLELHAAILFSTLFLIMLQYVKLSVCGNQSIFLLSEGTMMAGNNKRSEQVLNLCCDQLSYHAKKNARLS